MTDSNCYLAEYEAPLLLLYDKALSSEADRTGWCPSRRRATAPSARWW